MSDVAGDRELLLNYLVTRGEWVEVPEIAVWYAETIGGTAGQRRFDLRALIDDDKAERRVEPGTNATWDQRVFYRAVPGQPVDIMLSLKASCMQAQRGAPHG